MFAKRGLKKWLVISSGCFLGVVGVILLLQLYGQEQSIDTVETTPTVQTPIEMSGQPFKPQKNVHDQQKLTEKDQSKHEMLDKLHTTNSSETVTNSSDVAIPLEKKDDVDSTRLESLSDKDIEILEQLTFRDLLSDEELEEHDRIVTEYLAEAKEIVPKIVELKARFHELRQLQKDLAKQKKWTELRSAIERFNETNRELQVLRQRASKIEAFLTSDSRAEFGSQIDKEKIEQFFEVVDR